MRLSLFLCFITLGLLSTGAADAKSLSGQESVRSLVAGLNISEVARRELPIPALLGFSAVPLVGTHLKSASHSGLPHGVTGGTIGAIVGGAIGWASVRIHCESGVPCPTTRSTLTGAAIGAVLGVVVEYAIRNRTPPGSARRRRRNETIRSALPDTARARLAHVTISRIMNAASIRRATVNRLAALSCLRAALN